MNKRLVGIVTLLVLAAGTFAEAQQTGKVSRIGFLDRSTASSFLQMNPFLQGLRELGYEEGKNIVIEWRFGDAAADRVSGLLAAPPERLSELVRLKVDVIVAVGAGDISAAKKATTTIPIVMIQGGDPVGSGFVASLARPGGNITGLALLRPELSGKRLELLKETVPRLSRVAVFASSTSPDYTQTLKEIQFAAEGLGVKLQSLDIRSSKEF